MTLSHTPPCTTTTPDRFEDEETGLGYDVYQDTDAEDPRTWIGDDEKVAVHVFDGPRGDKDDSVPENLAAQAFARFYELWDAPKSLEATRRWLAVFHPEAPYDLAVSTIRGHSQGDWAKVFAASIIDFVDPATGTASPGYGTAQGHIDQYSSWRWGNVWTVSPDAGESLSGIYAEFPEDALKQYLADNPPPEKEEEPVPDEEPVRMLDAGLLAPDFEAPGLKRWTTGHAVIAARLAEPDPCVAMHPRYEDQFVVEDPARLIAALVAAKAAVDAVLATSLAAGPSAPTDQED